MGSGSSGAASRNLHTLLNLGRVGDQTDRQLIQRFLAREGDAAEAAFATLVDRHGPMVLGVCRRILADPHDIEDAFQATFLVLVKKAGSVRVEDSLGRWLYGVSVRVAQRSRAVAARQRTRERPIPVGLSGPPPGDAARSDLRALLDEELVRLPATQRAVLVLCYLEGHTHEQAARRLGWPVGTVRSRLARGRERLRARLTRRGLVPSTGPWGATFTAEVASALVPPSLTEAVARTAMHLDAGTSVATGSASGSIVILAEGVVRTMFREKLKSALAGLLILIAGTGAVALAWRARGAEDPPKVVVAPVDDAGLAAVRGNWIVRGYPAGQAIAVTKIDGKDHHPEASLLSIGYPGFILGKSRIEDLRVDDRSVRFRLRIENDRPADGRTFHIVAYRPEGQRNPGVLLGSMELWGSRWPVRLERTDLKELGPKDAALAPAVDSAEWKGLKDNDIQEKKRLLSVILEKYPGEPSTVTAASALMILMADSKAPRGEVLPAAERSVRLAAPYGRELELFAVHHVAWRCVEMDPLSGLAADYARRAEAMLRPSDSIAVRASVLKTLASALLKTGKKEEARLVAGRVAELDEILDREYLKTAATVKAEAFAKPRAPGCRTVLLELFTGARCDPCVGADAAFDALIRTYRPEDVVLIQYHLHIPGFDALTNEGSEARARYYKALYTPFACVDGRDLRLITLPGGTAESRYEAARKSIEERMEPEPGAELALEAERKGDTLHIRAKVSRLKKMGESIRLRFVLVEKEVRYEGSNGVRLHHHVARAFPGGFEGFVLKAESAEQSVDVNLAEVIQGLNRYLDGLSDRRFYPDNERPIDFGALRVIVIIQDDVSKEVFQAAQVEVPNSMVTRP